jgi:hypothetical protein
VFGTVRSDSLQKVRLCDFKAQPSLGAILTLGSRIVEQAIELVFGTLRSDSLQKVRLCEFMVQHSVGVKDY